MESSVVPSQWLSRAVCRLAMVIGVAACHSARLAVPVDNPQLPAVIRPLEEQLVRVQGRFYGAQDSSNVISGVEVDFSFRGTDAAVQHWRDTTKADGSYRVAVPASRTYQVALNKDGKNIETQEFPVSISANNSAVIKDFLLAYDESEHFERWWPTIYFATNRFDLRPQSLTVMESVVRRLNSTPDSGLLVEGHAGSSEVPRGERNPRQYLLRLGQRRAEAAHALLVKKGISESRLTTFSYGAKRPAAPNDTPEHRQLNRKVEFRIIGVEFMPPKDGNQKVDSRKPKAMPSARPVPLKPGVRPRPSMPRQPKPRS